MPVTTTENYWDCECPSRYIHTKREAKCPVCGAFHEDQPDAHMQEVIKYLIRYAASVPDGHVFGD